MTNKKEWDKFAKETIPTLKKLGYLKQSKWVTYVKLILWIVSLMVVYYISSQGYLKSNMEQNVTIPDINVNPTNNYDFKPSTMNDYTFKPNYTIYNTIVVPGGCNGS